MAILKVPYNGEWAIIESPSAVKFTEQTLTDAEKAQARENIGVADIEVDSALNTTSTNPVQNKVVSEAIDELSRLVGDVAVTEQIDAAIDTAIDTAINAIPIADNDTNGLMTSVDKEKLDAIESNAQKNVQSDWAQNDMTSMEFVQNRPFYDGPLSITWDGVTEGYPAYMYGSSNYLIKITDTIFTDEELQTAKFVISENGTATEVSVADVWEGRYTTSSLTGIDYNGMPCVYVVRQAGSFVGSGTYFLYKYSSNIYIQSFTVGSDTDIKKIDEKYIPDTIARMDGVQDIVNNMEFITIDDIDIICGGIIQYVNVEGVKY